MRVGRRVYNNKIGTYVDPSYPGFTKILVLTKSTEYGSLGPYVLTDEKDRIMENVWQFQKLYKTVPAACEKLSRYDKTIIWQHPEETHIDKNKNITEKYWKWREKGMNNKYYVRYPVGFNNMSKCVCAIKEFDDGTFSEPLDYIQARKHIYVPLYCRLVKKQKQFKELQNRLKNGEKLLIIEVDGPHQESLDYYKEKYHVADNFITNYTIEVTKENMEIMLNDPKHPFGHGYCLAMALLNKDDEWTCPNPINKTQKPTKIVEIHNA